MPTNQRATSAPPACPAGTAEAGTNYVLAHPRAQDALQAKPMLVCKQAVSENRPLVATQACTGRSATRESKHP